MCCRHNRDCLELLFTIENAERKAKKAAEVDQAQAEQTKDIEAKKAKAKNKAKKQAKKKKSNDKVEKKDNMKDEAKDEMKEREVKNKMKEKKVKKEKSLEDQE